MISVFTLRASMLRVALAGVLLLVSATAFDLETELQQISQKMAAKYNCSISVGFHNHPDHHHGHAIPGKDQHSGCTGTPHSYLRSLPRHAFCANYYFALCANFHGKLGVLSDALAVAAGIKDREAGLEVTTSDNFVWGSVTKVHTVISHLRYSLRMPVTPTVAPSLFLLLPSTSATSTSELL